MTVKVADQISAPAATDPAVFTVFFPDSDQKDIARQTEQRECSAPGQFPPPCDVNLFLGTFFDGTNNNLKRDRPKFTQSNVARLYEAFPGGKDDHDSEPWPDLAQYPNFFRTYIPGVGTEFDKVGDSGKGFNALFSDRAAGLAFARHGEARILWALVQTINDVHRYYTGAALIGADRFRKEFRELSLMSPGAEGAYDPDTGAPNLQQRFDDAFGKALRELHGNLAAVLPRAGNQPPKSMDKGWVKGIYFSCFGFSRGAALARAFANWFVRVCRLDARIADTQGQTLGGIPVTFDFLGLFDTVASVGLANSFLGVPDGHQAWADAETSLRVPAPVRNCLHLVSAHEIRRSFPLDSIQVGEKLSSTCSEIVFPGVHSDVGGGYRPTEQGRGTDPEGHDKLSRIPLGAMYRAARLAGVPLKLERAPDKVKSSFRVAPDTAAAFNAYLAACPDIKGQLHELMAEQHLLYIRWRKLRLHSMAQLPSVMASDKHDRTDLVNANQELQDEVRWFEEEWFSIDERHRGEGKRPEWESIAKVWKDTTPPHPALCDLFENYVHDSRAWFKPHGKDIPDLERDMDRLVERMRHQERYGRRPERYGEPSSALSDEEMQAAQEYLRLKEAGKLREALTPHPDGREKRLLGGGYLRFRKIYFGFDGWKPSGAVFAAVGKESVAA